MSQPETSLKYETRLQLTRRRHLTHKQNPKKEAEDPERYTIFHALFEAIKDKDNKNKR